MTREGLLLVFLYSLCGLYTLVKGQGCPVDIPGSQRRECHPWPDATLVSCLARGCVYCANVDPAYPFCFYDDTVCPSDIADGDRVDCLPEGGEKFECNAKNCIWCESGTPGIPWCFEDLTTSQGGAFCPDDIDLSERVDCHPEAGVTVDVCMSRGCYYCEEQGSRVPWCFAPKQRGYKMVGDPVQTPQGYLVNLMRDNTPSWYGADITNVNLEVEFQTDDRLRLRFTDADNGRFQVPISIEGSGTMPENPKYAVEFTTEPVFNFKVTRVSTGATILDTSIGGFTFSDQFIQLATYLDSSKIYGLGEHEHHTFPHNTSWSTWGMWTRDQATTTSNLYGQQPFYMLVENSNDAHAVLFLNSNAQDVVLMPEPALTFRTIGGILDMYIFMGPEPEQVVQQYHQAIGLTVMPTYWSLGFQLCRWGYENLQHMQEAVERMRQYNIPHDVQYGDIDYMDSAKDFTLDMVNFAGLPDYIQQLKQEGTRFIIILDPGIYNQDAEGDYPPFDRGMTADVWVKDSDGTTNYPGEVWPGPVFYPDYSKQSCVDWWTNECVLYKDVLDFEGLWVDMNEPSSFVDGRPDNTCADTKWNNPPFLPKISDNLWKKTMCMEARQEMGEFYNVHSLYGWSMAYASQQAAIASTGHRSITYSRSTFPGAGQWAQHWLGDNWSTWDQLRWSIYGLFEFNMFGMPYVGADICGFIGATTEEMCARWHQLGAFYTFSRNHNADGNPDQDPGMWPSVGAIAADTLRIRYNLLPYLYTLFHSSHVNGGTVIRPLFFEFVQDPQTHALGDQFLWGPAFMISPVLDEGMTSVNAYFPDAPWYDYYDGSPVGVRGDFQELDAPLEKINLHVRGGYILPTQQPANSTMYSRLNPMGILVALNDDDTAFGDMFWDDGESIDTYENGDYLLANYTVERVLGTHLFHSNIVFNGYDPNLYYETITVYGQYNDVIEVFVNGTSWIDFEYNDNEVLHIFGLQLDVTQPFDASWG